MSNLVTQMTTVKNIFIILLLSLIISKLPAQSFPSFYVRTDTTIAMLGYGLGQDRLGGAKMGYVDSNIVLKVIDSTKDLYKVQLSNAHTAYISRRDATRDASFQPKPFYVTDSWSVKGGDLGYDTLTISVGEKLPYKTWMEVNPSKIKIQIYGVQSNTNWITQLQTVKEVANVDYEQVEDDVMEITVDLKHKQHWGYTARYKGNALQLYIRHQPKKLDLQHLVVGIDAGHGGTNEGATGVNTNAKEKEYTLKMAKAVEAYFKKMKVKTIMTRTTDTSFNNYDRIAFLQQQRPDFVISIHLNSAGRETAQGVSTYYKHIGFRPLSQAVLKRMLELKIAEFGNVGSFNFALNAPTDFPNMLLEVLFLSNAQDEKKILDPKFHKALAQKVYLGMNDWLMSLKTSSK
jgi:N-acetylmuramoyl-L-alanine amidase